MRCKALAVFDNIDNKHITLHIPEDSTSSFWTKTAARTIKATIRQEIQALYHDLESGNSIVYPSILGYIHVQKLNHHCCAVITDTELSQEQIKYLTLYALSKKRSLKRIAENISQYTQDFRLPEMKSELGDCIDRLQILHQQLEYAIARQSLAANDLDEQNSSFQTLASQVNSWWSLSYNIL